MPLALVSVSHHADWSMVPFYSLFQNDWKWGDAWFWSCANIGLDMMLMIFWWFHQQWKAPLHYLHQDNQNEEQHDFSCHLTQLLWPLTSHDASGVVVTWCLVLINDTIIFLVKITEVRCNIILLVIWCHGHHISIMWGKKHYQLNHYTCLVKMIKMKCKMTIVLVMPLAPMLASCDADGIINGTITFLMSM